MNIVELHERVRFWTDTVQSARFESSDLDNAVNAATNDIVEQKYYSSRRLTHGDSFQRTQKIRNELQTLVKFLEADSIGVSLINYTGYSEIPAASYPTDYKYLLCIAIYDGAIQYNCWPITYDQINSFPLNPFRKPRIDKFPKSYYNESATGITITHAITSPSKALFYYLSQATQWAWGIEHTITQPFTSGQQFIVTSEYAIYNSVTYLRGTSVLAAPPSLSLTYGTAISNHVNSDVNSNLHELIARQGAVNALISIKEFDKAKALIEFFQ